MIAAPLPADALASFVVFAELLNFTHAARRLHLSQPAVFQHVRRLADELGAPLYRRHGQRLELTPQGQQVAAFARSLHAQTAALRSELQGVTLRAPSVLCAGEGAFLYVLGEPVSRLLAAGTPLELLTRDTSGTLDALRVGLAHVGVAVLDHPPPDCEASLLLETPQTLVLPRAHPLARRKQLRVRDLAGLHLVVPPQGRPLRALIDAATRAAAVDWQVAVEASGWPLLLHFVKLGVGAAVVNGCCRPPAGLVALPLLDLPPTRYQLLRRRGDHDAPRRALWDALLSSSPPPPRARR